MAEGPTRQDLGLPARTGDPFLASPRGREFYHGIEETNLNRVWQGLGMVIMLGVRRPLLMLLLLSRRTPLMNRRVPSLVAHRCAHHGQIVVVPRGGAP